MAIEANLRFRNSNLAIRNVATILFYQLVWASSTNSKKYRNLSSFSSFKDQSCMFSTVTTTSLGEEILDAQNQEIAVITLPKVLMSLEIGRDLHT